MSLYVDELNITEEHIPLYIINASQIELTFYMEQGIYPILRQSKLKDKHWTRVEPYIPNGICGFGNAKYAIPPDSYFQLNMPHLTTGTPAPIRYKLYGETTLASNEFLGYYDPALILSGKYDYMSHRYPDPLPSPTSPTSQQALLIMSLFLLAGITSYGIKVLRLS